jgi:hypothetical protein
MGRREVQQGCIKGIELPGASEHQTVAQFADDTSLSIRGEEVYVLATVETLNRFCSTSGLLINESKSTAYFWDPGGRE